MTRTTPLVLDTCAFSNRTVRSTVLLGQTVFNLSSVLLPALLVILDSVDEKDQLQPGAWKGLLDASTRTTGMFEVRGGSGVHQKLK